MCIDENMEGRGVWGYERYVKGGGGGGAVSGVGVCGGEASPQHYQHHHANPRQGTVLVFHDNSA